MLLQYLTEIIDKKDWANKYGPKIYEPMDKAFYKKALRFIKSKIFTQQNITDKRFIYLNPKGQKTLGKADIVKWDISDNDIKLVDLINEHTKFKIPKTRIASLLTIRKALKDKKIFPIDQAFNELFDHFDKRFDDIERQTKSRQNALQKAMDEWQLAEANNDEAKKAILEKKIAGIKRTIEKEKSKSIDSVTVSRLIDDYNKKQEQLLKNKYVIVLTYDTRAVASQSTGVSWESCMNLDDGQYKNYVGSSINIGTFVAYLATKKDKNILDKPIGRVLCKAYYAFDKNDEDQKNPDIIWLASVPYPGTKRAELRWVQETVQNFLNQNNKPKYRMYFATSHNYHDSEENAVIDIKKYYPDANVIENDLPKYNERQLKNLKRKSVVPTSFSELDDYERERVYEIAWDMAYADFDWYSNLDDRETRRTFIDEEGIDLDEYAMEDYPKEKKDFESEEEFNTALQEWLDENRDNYVDEAISGNQRKYQRFLKDIFDNDPGDFINSDDYIDEAFERFIDDNY